MKKSIFFFAVCCLLFSCQVKRQDHIAYLNKVNEIDSIYRIANDTVTALNRYEKLFIKKPAYQDDLIREFETYIKLSDKYKRDFGGKESLNTLIPLLAPNWKYNKADKELLALYKKYGIDSLELESKIALWKEGLNKRLIDSFSIARIRDQEKGRRDPYIQKSNDKKNAELLIWTFNHYGYPSLQKTGLWGNQDIFMPAGMIIHHMAGTDSYPYFRKKLLEYVRSGECPPGDYASMIDRYRNLKNLDCVYCTIDNVAIADSVRADKNRKKIGLPSIKHSKKILADYLRR